MSLLVAIETSTERGSVAIGTGRAAAADCLLGEVTLGVPARHAEALLPALDFLLRTLRLGRADIAGVVVGAGPGSFTGVRIAAATARGLAHGLGVPLYARSSLEALALNAWTGAPGHAPAPAHAPAGTQRVCALLDARRGEVYAACYDREPGTDALHAVLEPAALSVAQLLDAVPGPAPWFVGPGAARYARELGVGAGGAPLYPQASALLRLASADVQRGGAGEDATWEPAYVRASGAERGIAG